MLEIEGRTLLSRLIELVEPYVARVHVAVGYREDIIIEHCSRYHRHVVLVRNPDYRSTNTAFSMALGARGFHGKVIFLDGDLLISRAAFGSFARRAATTDLLVGLTRQTSEHGVFVDAVNADEAEHPTICGFTRDRRQPLEWANVFAGPARVLDDARGYVFEALGAWLPLPGHVLELAEVDTPGDLEQARRFGRDLGSAS